MNVTPTRLGLLSRRARSRAYLKAHVQKLVDSYDRR